MEKTRIVQNNQISKDKITAYPYHLDIIGKTSLPSYEINPDFIKYRRQWEQNPREQIVSDFPLHLNIEVTGRCNLMCRHCFRYSRRTGLGDMDFDLFKKIIDEGIKHNLHAISPGWMGEPFLHPRLMDMINYAKSKKILDVIVNTNGTLIDEEKSKEILDSGLDRIIISIDAVTEQIYNQIKFGSDFKLVNKNINYLIEQKEKRGLSSPTVIVQMIDQSQSHEELMAFVYYWKNKADMIRIATYQSPDGKPGDKRRIQHTPETVFPCPQLWQRLVVSWDGGVYPCVGDNACRELLGNVKQDNLYDIWHGDRLKYLRKKHSDFEANSLDFCLHCDLNKIPTMINNYGRTQG